MFRSVLSVLTLLAFMTASAVFAAPEAAAQKTDNDKAEFQQKAKAKFDEYNMKFKDWSEKAKGKAKKLIRSRKKSWRSARKRPLKIFIGSTPRARNTLKNPGGK